MTPSFSERVYRLVRRIPYGKVSTYGDIAALLGTPRAARGVGHALSALPHGSDVPWWRVLNRSGQVSLRSMGALIQRATLEQEGVRFTRGGRVELRNYRWTPAENLDGEADPPVTVLPAKASTFPRTPPSSQLGEEWVTARGDDV